MDRRFIAFLETKARKKEACYMRFLEDSARRAREIKVLAKFEARRRRLGDRAIDSAPRCRLRRDAEADGVEFGPTAAGRAAKKFKPRKVAEAGDFLLEYTERGSIDLQSSGTPTGARFPEVADGNDADKERF
jgi:hypothetical protein